MHIGCKRIVEDGFITSIWEIVQLFASPWDLIFCKCKGIFFFFILVVQILERFCFFQGFDTQDRCSLDSPLNLPRVGVKVIISWINGKKRVSFFLLVCQLGEVGNGSRVWLLCYLLFLELLSSICFLMLTFKSLKLFIYFCS